MNCKLASILTLAVALGLGTGIAPAQDSTGSEPLGDVARQLKAQRPKPEEKHKVFTNDDLTAPSPPGAQPAASPAKPSPTTGTEAKPGEKPSSANQLENETLEATPAEANEGAHGEKYYRYQTRKREERLQLDRRELNVLEQKLGQNQMQYYPDPNQGLLQESGPTAMSDIHNLQDEIEKKKAEIAADQTAIEDLRDQLRRQGGDPGWLRGDNPSVRADQTGTASEVGQTPGEAETPEGKAKTKEYWQGKFKSARAQLADAKERQQLAEDELNLLQIQDARELSITVKAELAEKIKAKEDEVSQARSATERAQKNLDDLENKFKESGAPEEWIET